MDHRQWAFARRAGALDTLHGLAGECSPLPPTVSKWKVREDYMYAECVFLATHETSEVCRRVGGREGAGREGKEGGREGCLSQPPRVD
jgi:hypothetical protein